VSHVLELDLLGVVCESSADHATRTCRIRSGPTLEESCGGELCGVLAMLTSHVDIAFTGCSQRCKLKSGIVLMPLIGWGTMKFKTGRALACVALVGSFVVTMLRV